MQIHSYSIKLGDGYLAKLNFEEDEIEQTRTSSSDSSIGCDCSTREGEEESLVLSSALTRTLLCLDNLELATPDTFEKETLCGNRVERQMRDEVATACLFVCLCGGAK